MAVVAAFAACNSSPWVFGNPGFGGENTSSNSTGSTSGSGSLTTGSTSAGAGGCVPVSSPCHTDADCNDGGDASTINTCVITDPSSEDPTGQCVYVACDGGLSCTMQPIDPVCTGPDAGVVYPAYVPLYAPDVPADCANGFEICDALGAPSYVIHATAAAGSRGLTLDLDFATYEVPDGLLITGLDSNCDEYVLFDSCRLKTSDMGESAFTNGKARPTDMAIRQFHLTLRPGTQVLTFDFSRVVSPMYFQVLGLCDFTMPAAPGVGWFSLVP
jgi:hypothetical protein